MRPSIKQTPIVVNVRARRDCSGRTLAYVRAMNRCNFAKVELSAVDHLSHLWTHIAFRVSFKTHSAIPMASIIIAYSDLLKIAGADVSKSSIYVK